MRKRRALTPRELARKRRGGKASADKARAEHRRHDVADRDLAQVRSRIPPGQAVA